MTARRSVFTLRSSMSSGSSCRSGSRSVWCTGKRNLNHKLFFLFYFCHLRLPLRIVVLGSGGGGGGQQPQRQEGREETHCVLLLWACFLLQFGPNAEEFFSSLQGEKAGRMRKECCCDKEPAALFVLYHASREAYTVYQEKEVDCCLLGPFWLFLRIRDDGAIRRFLNEVSYISWVNFDTLQLYYLFYRGAES